MRLAPWNPRSFRGGRPRTGAPVITSSTSAPVGTFRTAQSHGDVELIEDDYQDARRVYLPLQSTTSMPINTGVSALLSGRPQGLFRAVRLLCGSPQDTSGGFGVQVNNINVGVDSCVAEIGPLSAVGFQGTAFECGVTFPDAWTSMDCSVNVTNITGTTATIVAQMIGDFVKGGGLRLNG
jgi:hypothetical protein